MFGRYALAPVCRDASPRSQCPLAGMPCGRPRGVLCNAQGVQRSHCGFALAVALFRSDVRHTPRDLHTPHIHHTPHPHHTTSTHHTHSSTPVRLLTPRTVHTHTSHTTQTTHTPHTPTHLIYTIHRIHTTPRPLITHIHPPPVTHACAYANLGWYAPCDISGIHFGV